MILFKVMAHNLAMEIIRQSLKAILVIVVNYGPDTIIRHGRTDMYGDSYTHVHVYLNWITDTK